MSNYSKLNIVYRLQKWMDSVPGQTFLNYAYSWGASVVILGTLFKLTHLPGANIMLFAGMGTEVFVFFLSAFDRPFDKTAIGMDLPTHLYDEEENDEEAEGQHDSNACTVATAGGATVVGATVGGTIIIGGGATAGNATANDAYSSVNGADSSANAPSPDTSATRPAAGTTTSPSLTPFIMTPPRKVVSAGTSPW